MSKQKAKRKKINDDSDIRSLQLDEEEKELLASVERGEWKTVENFAKEAALAKKAATNSLRKNMRINIRISGIDLEHIKRRAVYAGLPYQTLIASVLHKYASGHLSQADN